MGTLKNMMRMMMLSTDDELRSMGRRSAELGRNWDASKWASTAVELIART